MSTHGTTSSEFPDWYIRFQQAALAALPRPPLLDQDTGLGWASNGEAMKKGFANFLLPPAEPTSVAQATSLPPQPIPIIRVDRSVRPVYPDWMKKLMHPELEQTGPADFDVNSLERWLHPDQQRGTIKGKKLYEHLKKHEMLGSCFGLTDLLAIQQKGIAFFREHFQGKAVFAWKSVVRSSVVGLYVPFLYDLGGEVVLRWHWLDDAWDSSRPALRFAK